MCSNTNRTEQIIQSISYYLVPCLILYKDDKNSNKAEVKN